MNKAEERQERGDLDALIQDLIRDHELNGVETELRRENKRLGKEGKHRDKTMDLMRLVKAYQENGTEGAYTCPFSPGDIVTWKKGMRNRSSPREGQLTVVLSVSKESFVKKE